MSKKYTFEFDCTNPPDKRALAEMLEDPTCKEISWRTFKNNVDTDQLEKLFPNYKWRQGRGGLHIQNDYAVAFYKSKYKGEICYFVEHSRIEYVFTAN